MEAEKPKRRSHKRGQRGSVIARSGGWTIVYRTPEGKQKWQGGFASRGSAQDALTDVLKKIKDRKYVDAKPKLFENFCNEWLDAKKAGLKPHSWANDRSIIEKKLKPALGKFEVREITRGDVIRLRDALFARTKPRKLSRKSVKNAFTLLHKLFEDAMDQELAASNPAHKIKLEARDDSEERRVPTPREVVLTAAKLPPTYQALLATAAMTGARRGELLGLFWEDIDWIRGAIWIKRSLQRANKKELAAGSFRGVERIGETGLVLTAPKSKKSKRFVEMLPKLAATLKLLRRGQEPRSFVFQDDLGRPLDPDAIYDVLHAAQDSAVVQRFGLHGLRHLYASALVDANAPVKLAQERLGHANSSTTMDIYAHNISDKGKEYAEAVEAAFPGLLPEAVQ